MFHWNKTGWENVLDANIMVHGAAFHNGQLLRGRAFGQAFERVELKPETWTDMLTNCNGFFAIASQKPEATIVAVDRLRSIPVFYGQYAGTVYISDDAEWVRQQVGDWGMDPIAREQFQLSGYVTGSNTLYHNVKQLQAGELLYVSNSFSPNLTHHRWYRFTHNETENHEEAFLLKQLDQSVESSVRRLAEYANGRQIIIPLSGGYDSRLIALMLKRISYENTLTFTYGVSSNNESEYSRKVAEALGLRWYFVEYSSHEWREWWQSEERLAYQRWSSGWVSLPHVQDWLAVRHLKSNDIADADAVFCPGHGAMAILSHLGKVHPIKNKNAVPELIFRSKFGLAPSGIKQHDRAIKRILLMLEDVWVGNEDPYSLFSYFEWCERQSKFLANSVRVYEYFGFDWWLPLWDSDFMSFWMSAPIDIRKGKGWYATYVKNLYASVTADGDLQNATALSPFYIRYTKNHLRRANINIYRWLYKFWKSKKYQTSPINPYCRYSSDFVSKRLMSGYTANGIDAEQFIAAFDFAEDPKTGLR